MPASAYVAVFEHETKYAAMTAAPVQLPPRPVAGPAAALARAFGCARVVFNDGLRARQDAYAAGQPYLTDAELSARLTAVQGDAGAGLAGRGLRGGAPAGPGGPERGVPEFLRLGHRASAKARRSGRRGSGPARTIGRRSGSPPTRGSRCCPAGSCGCRRSGTCRCAGPGRCRAAVERHGDQGRGGPVLRRFVVETGPAAARGREPVMGIDLGLAHFAVLSDGPQDRRPAVPAAGGEETQARAAGAVPQAERQQEPGQGQAQGRPCARPGSRRPARLPPPAVHDADPREPSGRRGGPGGGRARPHPAGQVRPRRRMVRLRGMLEYKARLYGRQFHRIGRFIPPRSCVQPAGLRTAPSRCTSAPGGARGAGRGWTGTSTRR